MKNLFGSVLCCAFILARFVQCPSAEAAPMQMEQTPATVEEPAEGSIDCSKMYTILECEYEMSNGAEETDGIEVIRRHSISSAWLYDKSQPEITRDGAQWLCYSLAQADAYQSLNVSYPGGARALIEFLQVRSDAGRLSGAGTNYLQLLLQGLAPVGEVTLSGYMLGTHPDCEKQPEREPLDPNFEWF